MYSNFDIKKFAVNLSVVDLATQSLQDKSQNVVNTY